MPRLGLVLSAAQRALWAAFPQSRSWEDPDGGCGPGRAGSKVRWCGAHQGELALPGAPKDLVSGLLLRLPACPGPSLLF